MYSLWSVFNSQLTSQKKILNEKKTLEQFREAFKSGLTDYYKPADPSQTIASLKNESKLDQNELNLINKFSTSLNLNIDLCYQFYASYINSPLNQFIITDDLLEKLQVEELFSAHLVQFTEYYYRERVCFLKNITFVLKSFNESHSNTIFEVHVSVCQQVFGKSDLTQIYKSCLKDYSTLCKEIKSICGSFSKFDLSNQNNFKQNSLFQSLKELEQVMELILILLNTIKIDKDMFFSLAKEFISQSIIKYLLTENVKFENQLSIFIEQISYLQAFIIIKSTRFDKLVEIDETSSQNSIESSNGLNYDEKCSLLSGDTKQIINDLIGSFGSTHRASPIILTWTTLIYKLSLDSSLAKIITSEHKTLINRMFALSIKENVFAHLIDLFAMDLIKNDDTLWHLKVITYNLINCVLNSFDESSLSGDNLRALFDLCFFCMDKNDYLCEKFWNCCQLADRDNITILMSYSIETFPISFRYCLTFYSLIAKVSPNLCKQIITYLNSMSQYCEYMESLGLDEYVANGETIQLIKNRKLFDGFTLRPGQKGQLLNANSSSYKIILQSQAINWQVGYSFFDLISSYLVHVNHSLESNNCADETNIISLIDLIDSLFKHFFEIDILDYEKNAKHMEVIVNLCFNLFSNIMNKESSDFNRILAKLFEFFNNISSSIYDKLIRLLLQNKLIGHDESFDKFSLEQLFANRFNLVNSSPKLLFIFKSQDHEMIINYIKLIDSLIKESGNNIHYMSPLCCVLLFMFPQVHKWKHNMLNLNMDLSLTCLNLLHTVLNSTSTTNSSSSSSSLVVSNILMDSFKKNFNPNFSIDQLCELILLNTECSESLLGLIHASFECSQDTNYLNYIKNFDNTLNRSISLLNRLIVAPSPISLSTSTQQELYLDEKYKKCSQSLLYSFLIRSITNPSNSSQISSINSMTVKSNVISNNNQFLLQLNLMMSKKNILNDSSNFDRFSLSTCLKKNINANKENEINWFHLLIKITLFKSNCVLDCLLFSLFKKISQTTPSLFGSLVGAYTTQFHDLILNKLKSKEQEQIITILSEFICSLIENQSGFFQQLAQLNIEMEKNVEKFTEGEKSVLKAMFELLANLKLEKNDPVSYHVTLSGIYSIFYAIWLNRKLDYMNYCKQKNEFWPNLSITLKLIRKKFEQIEKSNQNFNLLDHVKQTLIDYQDFFNNQTYITYMGSYEIRKEYLDYFGFKTDDEKESLNASEFEQFYEFIIDANIKSLSYAMKIFSIELYDTVRYNRKTVNNLTIDLGTYFYENIFDWKLVEKWLDFYKFQLKMDLIDECQYLLTQVESEDLYLANANMIVKTEMSILENYKQDSQKKVVKKKLKSKIIFNSIKSLILLINKTSRLSISTNSINVNRLMLDLVFNKLSASMLLIINHILSLNNILYRIQQEQSQAIILPEDDLMNAKRTTISNNISLKQSNDVVKQFHSLSNTLFILVSSISKKSDVKFDLDNLLSNLIVLLERLLLEEFNYFPSIINSIQSSILHLFILMKKESIEFLNSSIQKSSDNYDDGNTSMLKRLVTSLCKIFSKSCANLEASQSNNVGSVEFDETSHLFTLNVNLMKFVMSNLNKQYWHNSLAECCAVQFLYILFEKYLQNDKNLPIVNTILEMFYAIVNTQEESLIKSDFNTNTCLLAGKLFEYSIKANEFGQTKKRAMLVKTQSSYLTWSNSLRLYINIQTIMLKKFKYNYLNDSIAFFGSFYEYFIQVLFALQNGITNDLLETILSITRYLSQISCYKRELSVHITHSTFNLERLFCSLFQICVLKLIQIKMLINKCLHSQPLQSQYNLEDLNSSQLLIFSIVSSCMDSLFNCIPNLADPNFMTTIDEYRLLLDAHLAMPSSFDLQTSCSFGSVLWLIDYCLKLLHKHEGVSSNSTTTTTTTATATTTKATPSKLNDSVTNDSLYGSPSKRNVTIIAGDEMDSVKLQIFRKLVICVLEKIFNFLLTQIIICDLQVQYSLRDRKIFKRDLGAEINQIISGYNRTFKRTTSSSYASKSPTSSASTSAAAGASQTAHQTISNQYNITIPSGSKQSNDYFKCIQTLLLQNLID